MIESLKTGNAQENYHSTVNNSTWTSRNDINRRNDDRRNKKRNQSIKKKIDIYTFYAIQEKYDYMGAVKKREEVGRCLNFKHDVTTERTYKRYLYWKALQQTWRRPEQLCCSSAPWSVHMSITKSACIKHKETQTSWSCSWISLSVTVYFCVIWREWRSCISIRIWWQGETLRNY